MKEQIAKILNESELSISQTREDKLLEALYIAIDCIVNMKENRKEIIARIRKILKKLNLSNSTPLKQFEATEKFTKPTTKVEITLFYGGIERTSANLNHALFQAPWDGDFLINGIKYRVKKGDYYEQDKIINEE